MKILVIDDSPAVRATLRIVLADEFEAICEAGDPTLIPAILSPGDIDAVLLDMNFDTGSLNGEAGLFWLTRIKEMEKAPAVVMITAFGDIPLAVEAMRRGAEDPITKPWDNETLIEKLHQAIRKNRSEHQKNIAVRKAREIEMRDSRRRDMTIEQIKAEHAKEAVARCGGNLSAAAKQLGVNRQTLYNILKKE